MDLNGYRRRIDEIDDEIVRLFAERMETAAGIAAYKREHGLPVLDPAREREKLLDVRRKSPEGLGEYAEALYSLIMELSRSYQHSLLGTGTAQTGQLQRGDMR